MGVRAYQWGWEYYYPKTIDLNYNVRPSYSTFVGNSLKYNYTSGSNLSSNSLWRMYQNKAEDRVITPAHLMILPLDSNGMTNFLNFKQIGVNNLQESSAFTKIRNATKVYNSHLVHTPTSYTAKYHKFNDFLTDENTYLTSSSFGLKKNNNLISTKALGNGHTLGSLDMSSFNRFLESNSRSKILTSQMKATTKPSALSLEKTSSFEPSTDSSRLTSITRGETSATGFTSTRLTAYPTLIDSINDNSDKAGLNYPAHKLTSAPTLGGTLLNSDSSYARFELDDPSSVTSPHNSTLDSNESTSSKVFNLSGPNSKILQNDQSIRSFPTLLSNKSNYNLSSTTNSITSNLKHERLLNVQPSAYASTLYALSDYADYSTLNNLASSRSFMTGSYPAVVSSLSENTNSLDFDTAVSTNSTNSLSALRSDAKEKAISRGTVGDVFIGSREKTPKAINSAYWSTFWATSNPTHRINGDIKASLGRTDFYLPTFTAYSDYDFRNDQAIDMLEELVWENSYSGYNFYDYLTLSQESSTVAPTSQKDVGLEKSFLTSNLGSDITKRPLIEAFNKDTSILGEYYSGGVQMEDYVQNPNLIPTRDFSLYPLQAEMSDLDDSLLALKGLTDLMSKFSSPVVGLDATRLSPRSYLSVFNNFRSDYEDFTWLRSNSLTNFTDQNALTSESDQLTLYDGTSLGSDLRISNPATLRPSVRNSIVNFNAFQKVFKPRLDEGRAHSQSSSFADLGLTQPYLSDTKVPYLQLLGKNRDSFFNTPLYFSKTHKNFNSESALIDSINSPMYDFPFLLAKTSDTTRFTWIDWFAKWKYIEVQPSSVSRYSTLGVPYLRKPFDFNSTTGDKFQDTELYFTRVARSRRNYLTNWSYSPYFYNRAYVWNSFSDFDSAFLNLNNSLSSASLTLKGARFYWSWEASTQSVSDNVNYSSSGNEVYGKSTWRPKASIEAYYAKTAKLIDLLSKREFLYRRFFENSFGFAHLPSSLTATPNNKLINELKSSFLFTDPATYSSEFSRDLFYTSQQYFKFSYLQSLVNSSSNYLSSLPLNASLLTDYVFFYFFSSDLDSINRNGDLYKSQFRPLKKGISSMLRLHATGAVAMPIEIRLQVLASSRDVIHSWAIPSASVKIDCVPGYTSHRTMKFLLTGVYWGQCQEICGRYHHWMPIVVYFMKRDLFFLWCTHFVFASAPNDTWDISDRRFADFVRFASYDKATWLSEFSGTN